MYKLFFKRIIDIFLSVIFILLFWWLYIIIVILVRRKLGSPVIFRQKRPGLNEKIFTMYKFRTMTDKKDENGNLLPDKDRLTKFGKFLRSTSLDEIPELLNVLKGEMSLVGPRPLLVEYLSKYTKDEKRKVTENVKRTQEEGNDYEVLQKQAQSLSKEGEIERLTYDFSTSKYKTFNEKIKAIKVSHYNFVIRRSNAISLANTLQKSR